MKTLLILFFLINSLKSFAEGPPWIRVTGLSFEGDKKALELYDGDYLQNKRGPTHYEITNELTFLPLNKNEYEIKFLPQEVRAPLKIEEVRPKIIKNFNGDIFQTKYSNCEENGDLAPHCKGITITYNNKEIKLDVTDQCQFGCEIKIAEIINGNLWVGLASHGEYNWYGHGIQVYDPKAAKRIYSYLGKEYGDLVSIIKQDPKTGLVWLTTDTGISIIDLKKKSVEEYNFYYTFNSKTNLPQIDLAKGKIPVNNSMANIATSLGIKSKDFYIVSEKIPKAIRDTVENFRNFYNDDQFVPLELNVLVPFFIEAIQSKDNDIKEFVSSRLCNFKDPRAYLFVKKNYIAPGHKKPVNNYELRMCYEKYLKNNLL
ncbi:MAG: hypothetical protein WC635_09050 [Bacteriovorax sp.]|jgi:hypothetical protein